MSAISVVVMPSARAAATAAARISRRLVSKSSMIRVRSRRRSAERVAFTDSDRVAPARSRPMSSLFHTCCASSRVLSRPAAAE